MRKTTRWRRVLQFGVFYLLMAAGVSLMLAASLSYVELGDEHPFFLEKLPLANPQLWLTALYVHVPSSLFALPATLWLSSPRLGTRFPRLHRYLGRFTALLVLFASVPSGCYLALFAQGGAITTLGFWLTGAIAATAMVMAVRAARTGEFKAHRHYSRHVAAQLSVAVFSRFALVAAEYAEIYDSWVYVAALWVPVVACALFVELTTGRISTPSPKGSRHEVLAAVSSLDAVR
ncbi:MAG: DUF2306 domain-containing protein [Myxococcales bacterium]|nr:DUF2306 domain-containing protein [Myxococcales bacterium]